MAKTHNNPITRDEPMLVSVIAAVCNQADDIQPLLESIVAALGEQDCEVLVVDDGSTDATAEAIEAAAEQDSRICGLRLARSFGNDSACRAGLRYAAGEVAIVMTGLQLLPPDLPAKLIDEWRQGHNVVRARSEAARSGDKPRCPLKRLRRRLWTYLTGTHAEAQACDALLLDRQAMDEINRLRGGRWRLNELVAWMGCRCADVRFDTPAKTMNAARCGGESNDDAIPGLSPAAMRLGVCAGLGLAGLCFIYVLCLLVWMLVAARLIVPWAIGLAVLTLAAGVALLLLSLQGAYLAHLCRRTEPSPAFLVERVIGQPRRLQISAEPDDRTEPDSPPPLRIFT
jgi:dolichol-phosphate mannosyltransferase